MAKIWCLGSINIDLFYRVPHLPAPGETLAALDHDRGLGGKGANQSVAASKAGAQVYHIGCIGASSDWIIERLQSFGVDTTFLRVVDEPTGHAIINVDQSGENSIVIYPGANIGLNTGQFEAAIASARAGDILLMQNETNLQTESARIAAEKGMRVFYSAAPFDAKAVEQVIPYLDALLMNEIESQQLSDATGSSLMDLPIDNIVVTHGERGARWLKTTDRQEIVSPGIKVRAVDTTGAGDTFAGYLAASVAAGQKPQQAIETATRAAALKVTKRGTADAIPTYSEVQAFSA
ncbi:MAG: ribokinase [Boseongicola sp.]|nr:MAG: ribokinase [Boseongicola sp.]